MLEEIQILVILVFVLMVWNYFFNVSCPHHKILKNRNLGDFITFVINPRENFDYVAPKNSEKGRKIRKTIRDRVVKFIGFWR